MAGKADSPKLYQQTPLVRISKIAETIFEDGVSTTIRKFHDKETQSFSKEPVIPQWCSVPSSATEAASSSLEGGEEEGGDDDDNIAYSTVVQGLSPGEDGPSHTIFCHSLLHAGHTVSLTALHIPSHTSLFVYLKSGDMSTISKECFVSLLEYAEVKLHCSTVYVFFEKMVSHELRQQILHCFRVMGFQLVPPSHHVISSMCSDQYYFLSYELEGDSDDDDDDD